MLPAVRALIVYHDESNSSYRKEKPKILWNSPVDGGSNAAPISAVGWRVNSNDCLSLF